MEDDYYYNYNGSGGRMIIIIITMEVEGGLYYDDNNNDDKNVVDGIMIAISIRNVIWKRITSIIKKVNRERENNSNMISH